MFMRLSVFECRFEAVTLGQAERPCPHRDVLYLDLALEGAVRTVLEGVLGGLDAADLRGALALLALGLENTCLSLGSNRELVLCLKDLQARRLLGFLVIAA